MTNECIQSLLNSLEELNDWLAERKAQIDLTIIGRFAFFLAGFSELATVDIDTVTALQDDVYDKILSIGKHSGLKPDWLNDNSEGLPLPEGFETRLVEYRRFSNIHIRYAARKDLISLKAAAYVSRGADDPKDFQDLLLLEPTNLELEEAIQFIRKNYSPPQKKFFPDFEEKLDELRTISAKKF